MLSPLWFLCPYPQPRYKAVPAQQGSFMLPFNNDPSFPSTPPPLTSVPKLCHFQVLYKWNHIIYKLWGLAFFLTHHKSSKLWHVSVSNSFLAGGKHGVSFQGMCASHRFTIHLVSFELMDDSHSGYYK